MLKTLIVPTDGSAHADKAVELAGDLASKYDSKVVLLHILLRGHMPEGLLRAARVEQVGEKSDTPSNLVNMPQEIMARVGGKGGTQMSVDTLKFIADTVLARSKQICRDKGVSSVEVAVEEGNPTEIILDYAERTDADMIIMGHRGLTSLKGLLLGSISTQVGNLAKCTCVTVK